MNRLITGIMIISAILFSGCVSTVAPVNPEDVLVDAPTIIVREFQETDIGLSIANNGSVPIDSVKVSSFNPFSVVAGGNTIIPARTEKGPSQSSIYLKIQSPGFRTDVNETMIILSYASGKNETGEAIEKTKSIPARAIILPNAKLQFVGFVKGLENITETESSYWELKKGKDATITFSVKNEGRTTIEKDTLKVVVDIENKEIGSSKSLTIKERMAKGGTSYTEALVLPVNNNAPNGETDVLVTLYMGENIIDSKTLKLRVLL